MGLPEPSRRFEWSVWTSWLVELPLEGAVEELCSAGFSSLELSAEHFNEYLARRGLSQRFLDCASMERALTLAKRGPLDPAQLPPIRFVHAHGPFHPFRLAAVDELERSLEIISKWIEHCSELGVDVLVCHPFTLPSAGLEEEAELNARAYGALSRVADDCGVLLAVENIPRGFGSRAEHLTRIVEACASSVAVCVDTGHANIEAYRGRVAQIVAELRGFIAATHLSDNDGSGDQHLFPGRGAIDWRSVLRAFREAGYGKPLNLEIPGEARAVSSPRARVTYLTSLLREFERRVLAQL